MILEYLAIHFVGDFGLQSQWMAENKGKSWEVMAYHCGVYATLFSLIGAGPIAVAFLFLTHFLIDTMKARYGIVKYIWQDFLLHMIPLATVIYCTPKVI